MYVTKKAKKNSVVISIGATFEEGNFQPNIFFVSLG